MGWYRVRGLVRLLVRWYGGWVRLLVRWHGGWVRLLVRWYGGWVHTFHLSTCGNHFWNVGVLIGDAAGNLEWWLGMVPVHTSLGKFKGLAVGSITADAARFN